ncbi:AfsR/SARP family transcriptional regulator [Catenuloplanes indicus]|uniref:DNA-binding SARP family transcriptional activator n=1 Tax=Catenuloplanes indicus TaxID=137267 RepID=A0AAE3W4Y7_9ACTN|nr:AfsR/SARP family transcriptional regulator [Catenuloplanes indicus]MDQ0369521.1 DNA-binding SARP family transcriptional activator [Catenuloplanes indicus]
MDWDFRLLGPLEIRARGMSVEVSAARQRAVLVILLLQAGRVVADRQLIEQLWGADPPLSARQTLQSLVCRLRRTLESVPEAERILHTRAPGYQLAVAPSAVDLNRFRALVVRGREALRQGDARGAADDLGAALRLWRGDPLADVAAAGLRESVAHGVAGERLDAVEEWGRAQLGLGRYQEAVVELQAVGAAHPLRERLHHLLMCALYGVGRQAEALATYRVLRRRLIADLGVEPSRELSELHARMLNHDESLRLSFDPVRPRPSRTMTAQRRVFTARRARRSVLRHR